MENNKRSLKEYMNEFMPDLSSAGKTEECKPSGNVIAIAVPDLTSDRITKEELEMFLAEVAKIAAEQQANPDVFNFTLDQVINEELAKKYPLPEGVVILGPPPPAQSLEMLFQDELVIGPMNVDDDFRKEKLKQSQAWKKKNQTHPAWRK